MPEWLCNMRKPLALLQWPNIFASLSLNWLSRLLSETRFRFIYVTGWVVLQDIFLAPRVLVRGVANATWHLYYLFKAKAQGVASGLLKSTSSLSHRRRAKERRLERGWLHGEGFLLCLILHLLLQGRMGQEQEQSRHKISGKQRNQANSCYS